MSVTNSLSAPPGSSRIEFTRASIPSTCPAPSMLPVIGRVAKSLSSNVNVGAAGGAAITAAVAATTRVGIVMRMLFAAAAYDLPNHTVALAVDVELAAPIHRETRIRASLVRHLLPRGQPLGLPTPLMIDKLVDGPHAVERLLSGVRCI